MKDIILLELVRRWEVEAKGSTVQAAETVDYDKGCRETLRACADTLKTLVSLLGEEK